MSDDAASGGAKINPANRLGLDYRQEAGRFRPWPGGIIDSHLHIGGARTAEIWAEAADLYSVSRCYSQTRLVEAAGVRRALGDRVRFVAIPDYGSEDREHAFGDGFVDAMKIWREEHDARMVKFWMAPRLRDYTKDSALDGLASFDSKLRRSQMETAADLGYVFMTHTGDPDTWFKTKYADASVYGTKEQQYEPLERAIEDFKPIPWLLAHMAGWPEDLGFLDGILSRHDNVVLDTSATKWMSRELSKHDSERFRAFLTRWSGRVLFGSDIVTMDGHLETTAPPTDGRPAFDQQASSAHEAFDLYASRYWALRTLFETDYDGEAPIADPDLMLVEPDKHDQMSAPRLRGHSVGQGTLDVVYREACEATIDKWYA